MAVCDNKRDAMDAAIAAFQKTVETESQRIANDEENQAEEEMDQPRTQATFKFKVDFKDTEILIPEITVTQVPREVRFNAPQVTMKRKSIKFDFVGTRMVNKKVGQYPETTCRWKVKHIGLGVKTKIWQCTTTWHDIITKVPEVYKEAKEITLDLPEFSYRETGFDMKVPEITVSQKKIVLKLPQFTLESVVLNPENAEEDAAEAEQEATEFAKQSEARTKEAMSKVMAEGKAALSFPVNDYFECVRTSLLDQKEAALGLFTASINQIDAAIKVLVAQGADDAPELAEYQQRKKTLQTESQTAATTFDQQIADLLIEERELIDGIVA